MLQIIGGEMYGLYRVLADHAGQPHKQTAPSN
jgi:hypothetical protein